MDQKEQAGNGEANKYLKTIQLEWGRGEAGRGTQATLTEPPPPHREYKCFENVTLVGESIW